MSRALTINLYGIHEFHKYRYSAGEKLRSQNFENLKHVRKVILFCSSRKYNTDKYPLQVLIV